MGVRGMKLFRQVIKQPLLNGPLDIRWWIACTLLARPLTPLMCSLMGLGDHASGRLAARYWLPINR